MEEQTVPVTQDLVSNNPPENSSERPSDSVIVGAEAVDAEGNVDVVFKFCDRQESMVTAWREIFQKYIPDKVEVLIYLKKISLKYFSLLCN